jgi:hypothetical protein
MHTDITLLIQTAKDRLRYLDTTFNSVIKVLPQSTEVYISCDTPSDKLLQYLTTTDTIELDNTYLYPNEHTSWKKYIGYVENKKHVTDIYNKYKELIFEKGNHRYKKFCTALNTVVSKINSKYILYIEDDCIFKDSFYNKILECIDFAKGKNIGRVAIFNRPKDLKGPILQLDNTPYFRGANQCLLLNCNVLRKLNLCKYRFRLNHLPPVVRKRIKKDFIPETGADVFLANLIDSVSSNLNYAFKHEGICQHIGVLSSLYKNVEFSSTWSHDTEKRCFFDTENNLLRIDKTASPPYLL